MSSPASGVDGGRPARALTGPPGPGPAGGAGRPAVALRGSLDEVPLFDLLRLLAATTGSGVLRIHRPFAAEIHLAGGRIGCVRAEGSASLGEALRRGGVEERAAPGRHPAVDRVLAAASDPARAERVVRGHVRDLLFELAVLGEGSFEYAVGVPDPWSGALSTDVAAAAGEHDRDLAEWKEVAAVLPPPSAALAPVSRLADDVAEVVVARDEWSVLSLLDGRRTLAEVVAVCELAALETSRALAGLVRKGLVAPAP